MFNITRKYVTVFNPTIKLDVSERIVFADISTSKKNVNNGEVTYENMLWKNTRFVGEAFEPAKALHNGDIIDIVEGAIENHYDKEKKKQYTNVIVFKFEFSVLNATSAELPDFHDNFPMIDDEDE